MTTPNTTALSLSQIETLARDTLLANGCNTANADAIARTVMTAERDGSTSHGLFRMPGYIAGLRSGKVSGVAEPAITHLSPASLAVDGQMGYAPYTLEKGLPLLVEAAQQMGIGVMKLTNSFHFAALWPETETLSEAGLVGIACTAFKPTIAPAGSKTALLGTNPLSFSWPRPGKAPLVFDMATARLAKGDVQIAARDGHELPDGTGLGPDGEPTNDPNKVLQGVQLPFGGYKGSAIALMVELLAAGMTGDQFSYEAAENDNNDGAPPKGGELVIALNPAMLGGDDWQAHCDGFFERLEALDGVRLPGARRHQNRQDTGMRNINAELVEKIQGLKG